MISHRCRYKARGSVLMRVFTSSSVRWVAARVTLAISSLFSFQSSPPLFYHSTRISITGGGEDCFVDLTKRGGSGTCALQHAEHLLNGPAQFRLNDRHNMVKGRGWHGVLE